MKTRIQNPFLLSVLIAGLGLILAGRGSAQIYENLHVFTNWPTDGANPQAGLILLGNTLYGTASSGGDQNSFSGTLFKVNTDGTHYTNFYYFSAASEPFFPHTNYDGAFPEAGLVSSGSTLYGTASGGGTWGNGTVFAVNTDGSGFTNLHSFTAFGFNGTNNDGAVPLAGLLLSGNTLYGTAKEGGYGESGTVFAINTDGSGFTNLYSFTAGDSDTSTNLDGASPQAALILSGNTLYGTANSGGFWNSGTIFAVGTNGLGFTNLYNFSATDPDTGTNSDGANPQAALILLGNTLYGTASAGGNEGDNGSGYGTIFAINTDSTGFTNLYIFTADADYSTNSDGANPEAGLILLGNTLYGTAESGGLSGGGTVFAINTDGSDFTNLYSFNGVVNNGGANPYGGVIPSGGALYGTAFGGGDGGVGTVYSLSATLPGAPLLTITRAGDQVIVSWPSSVNGWTLQTNNVLNAGTWGNYSGPISSNSVTNSPSTGDLFFRLVF